MSGLEPEHPAAGTAYDDVGRSIHLYPTERTAKLECLKLAIRIGEAPEATVKRAKAYADFVLGTVSADAPKTCAASFVAGGPAQQAMQDLQASKAEPAGGVLHEALKSSPGYATGHYQPEKAKAPERPGLSKASKSLLQERLFTIVRRLAVLDDGQADINGERAKLHREHDAVFRDLGEATT